MNLEEIKCLQVELDKERRKSMADEAKCRKLEEVLRENERKNAGEIEGLKREIEAERRKSMVD